MICGTGPTNLGPVMLDRVQMCPTRLEYLRGTWEPGSCKILELVENP